MPRSSRDGAAGGGPPTVVLELDVQPRASRTELVGWRAGRLRVRVAAAPAGGAANRALIAYLADRLELPRSRLSLIAGTGARLKRLRIDGLDRSTLEARLAAPSPGASGREAATGRGLPKSQNDA